MCRWVRRDPYLAAALHRAVGFSCTRVDDYEYGRHVATDLTYYLSKLECTVIAGLGFGIETAALTGAIHTEGTPIAVLPAGIDHTGFAAAALLERVVDQGLAVTEWPPGAVPTRALLRYRYALLAALAQGAVVVEAGIRSGALALHRAATAIDRPVMAVPGPVTSTASAGCHGLIRFRSTPRHQLYRYHRPPRTAGDHHPVRTTQDKIVKGDVISAPWMRTCTVTRPPAPDTHPNHAGLIRIGLRDHIS